MSLNKTCTKCGIEKELQEFNLNPEGFMGRRSICLECRREEYKTSTPGRRRVAGNDERNRRRRHLSMKFGLTEDDYLKLLETQDHGCAICGSPTSVFGRNKDNRLAVDHDHKTGRIRGLLCGNCNIGLGQFKDDPLLLMAATRYLAEAEVVV